MGWAGIRSSWPCAVPLSLFFGGKWVEIQLQGLSTAKYAPVTIQVHVLTMLCSILLREGSLETRMGHMVGKESRLEEGWKHTHRQQRMHLATCLSVLGFLVLGRRWLVWPPSGCQDWDLWEGKEDFEEDWIRVYLLHWLSGFPSCFDPSTVQTKWNGIWAAALSGHVTAT